MSLNKSLQPLIKKQKKSLDSEHTSLLVSFCNQLSSPDCSLCIIDTGSLSSQWIDLSSIPDDFRNGLSGVCGICSVADDVIIATQGQSPVLATVSIADARITNYVALPKCKDPHSLVHFNGYVYVVSTGTNEIYRVPFKDGQFGKEELFWSYPGVYYERDEVHLNGLTIDGDNFIASCFGPKNSEGTWGLEGRIFHVESGHSICAGLNQPHSPIVSNDRLVFAESAAKKVYIYNKPEGSSWMLEYDILLNGYTRGLALREQRLWVGVSASRKLSRSQRRLLYENRISNDSELLSIDLVTGKPDSSRPLVAYGREPYDFFEINIKPNLLVESDSVNARIRNMESWAERHTADIGSLFSQISEYKTSNSELVSVIIPTYNREHLIEESVRSVLAQTYTNFEILVVDDGSTDNTEEVVAAITDPRLRYIHQPNRGRSNARNHALTLAKGKYITFLDSDDLYLPNKIELQIDYLKSHLGTGMVYTSAHCINDRGEILAHKYVASLSGLIYESIAFFTPVTITLPTVMTYKHVMDHVGGFDEMLHRFEDTDMWRRISKYCRIDAMPEYTCLLRTHDDNSLLNQNPDDIATALNCYATKILNEDTDIPLAIRKKGLAGLYLYYGQALLTIPHWKINGFKLLLFSFRYYPWLLIKLHTPHFQIPPLINFPSLIYLWHWVYYRSLNNAYKFYCKLKSVLLRK